MPRAWLYHGLRTFPSSQQLAILNVVEKQVHMPEAALALGHTRYIASACLAACMYCLIAKPYPGHH